MADFLFNHAQHGFELFQGSLNHVNGFNYFALCTLPWDLFLEDKAYTNKSVIWANINWLLLVLLIQRLEMLGVLDRRSPNPPARGLLWGVTQKYYISELCGTITTIDLPFSRLPSEPIRSCCTRNLWMISFCLTAGSHPAWHGRLKKVHGPRRHRFGSIIHKLRRI